MSLPEDCAGGRVLPAFGHTLPLAATRLATRKIPILGTALGLASTVHNAQRARAAAQRARNQTLDPARREAAERAAQIYRRRAAMTAVSTGAALVPGAGTAASVVLDGANCLGDLVQGNPEKIESKAAALSQRKTSAFMQEMRERAANHQPALNCQKVSP